MTEKFTKESMSEPSRVLEMYYVVILVVVTWVYRYSIFHIQKSPAIVNITKNGLHNIDVIWQLVEWTGLCMCEQ